MPIFSQDEALDLMVAEAVVLKHGRRTREMQEEQEKKRARDDWKRQPPGGGKAGRKRTG